MRWNLEKKNVVRILDYLLIVSVVSILLLFLIGSEIYPL